MSPCKVLAARVALLTSPASDPTASPLEIRCCVDVKYAEADTDSVESDTGGVWSATRATKTLHGDTAKHPRSSHVAGVGVFACLGRDIKACALWLRFIQAKTVSLPWSASGIYHLKDMPPRAMGIQFRGSSPCNSHFLSNGLSPIKMNENRKV